MYSKKTSLVLILFLSIFLKEEYCQNFKVSPLIEIPGDNFEFDILSPEMGIPNSETYICWINKHDLLYTVYLKQLSPIMGDNIIVSSDSIVKANPLIAINRYSQGIKIVWQCNENNAWHVYMKNYLSNQLSDPILILDSLETDPQISLSTHRLAWIDNENLFIKEFYPNLSENILVDTLHCSSPNLVKYDYLQNTQMLYEKSYDDTVKVNLVSYNQYSNPNYEYRCLSNGLLSKNPQFGINWEIAFQTYENDIWKSVYTRSSYDDLEITKNQDCNFNNPVLFTYPVPTSSTNNITTPFFLAFDTDSVAGNNEIFIKTFYYGMYDSLLNISQIEGDDYKPRVAYLSTSDSVFISVIWEHRENNRMNIWIAKDIFSPIITSIHSEFGNNISFKLIQNYPNPFNPTTTIEYFIGKPSNVKIVIYDALGKVIKTIVDNHKNAGIHEVIFDAGNLSSGIYYYSLIIGDNRQTKSMIILK